MTRPASIQRYAVLGRLTAKPRIDGVRVRVAKKVHIIRDGRSVCNSENAYKKPPRLTTIENPEQSRICRNCLSLDAAQFDEPSLAVLMGERMAEEPGTSTSTPF